MSETETEQAKIVRHFQSACETIDEFRKTLQRMDTVAANVSAPNYPALTWDDRDAAVAFAEHLMAMTLSRGAVLEALLPENAK